MCVGSVFTQPPYNDSFFFYLVKTFPLSHIKPFSDAILDQMSRHTDPGPPTIVDWQGRELS